MTTDWSTQPSDLALSDQYVDIWRTSFPPDPARVDACAALLSEDERERARRFRHEYKRREYIVTRATLRGILGRCTDRDPRGFRFAYGERGKPCLPEDSGCSEVQFNVTHSHGLALIAVTLHRNVGIDLEKFNAEIRWEALSRRYFSAKESGALQALAEPDRLAAFFACWTRKEALVKGMGDGIAFGLSEFDVSIAPDEPPRILEIRKGDVSPEAWSLAGLDAAPDYAATVAAEGGGFGVRCWGAG